MSSILIGRKLCGGLVFFHYVKRVLLTNPLTSQIIISILGDNIIT